MFRNTTLSAFLLTVAVLVPAGWHALRADLQTDGKRLRPLQESFTMTDGTRVTLDVDRSVILTGDTVTATLVAYSDLPRRVTVDLLALHTNNYGGERVEQPWVPIDHETLKLTAAPGGGPPLQTRIQLGERPRAPALDDSFQIYVTEPGKRPARGDDDSVDYRTGPSEGYAAATQISGWSGDNLQMSFGPEGRATAGAPFVVAVRVKNTSGAALGSPPRVTLTTEAALQGIDEDGLSGNAPQVAGSAAPHDTADADAGDAPARPRRAHVPAAVEIEPLDEEPTTNGPELARGEVVVRRFRVTVKQPGLSRVTLLAIASEYDNQPGPLTAGAEDARTFKLEAAKPEAAKPEAAPTMAMAPAGAPAMAPAGAPAMAPAGAPAMAAK